MDMHESEYRDFKETLIESQRLAKEHGITLSEVVALRTLCVLRWAQLTWCNKPDQRTPNTK